MRLGRVGDHACLFWEGDANADFQLVVEHGKTGLLEDATTVVSVSLTGGSPFVLPDDVLPPLRGGVGCFEGIFLATVLTSTGERVGGELWLGCEHHSILADGCVGPGRELDVNVARLAASDGSGYSATRCIVWEDRFDDETGFRIELTYEGSGEKFTYMAPANTIELIPPAGDVDGLGEIRPPNWPRKDYSVQVWAIRPAGETMVGSMSVQVM